MLIDPERLLADLHTLRGFGRRGNGVMRPAFEPPEIEARRWTMARMAEAGLRVSVDPAGNVFGLPEGKGPWLLAGSHTDSQPEGGWLDGAYGVIAALEAARALPGRVAVVNFQDEEGRFGGLTGSSLWAGQATGDLTLEEADAWTSAEGVAFGDARTRMAETATGSWLPPARFKGFLEIHIEQGPNLIEADQAVAVVDRIVGIGRAELVFEGEQNHAGTTPMARRRDAFAGLARFAVALDAAMAAIVTPASVWTIGRVAVLPGAPSIVPGRVTATVQWRDGDGERLRAMGEAIRETAASVARDRGLGHSIEMAEFIEPRRFDGAVCSALDAAAEVAAPGRWRRLPSGAMHDATNAQKAGLPSAMLFVPSIGGISHSFAEDTAEADLVAGAEALAQGAARLA
ncbi:MAG: hydantoinase/carbamoylase family amidase [Pseudomonadota bacterium]